MPLDFDSIQELEIHRAHFSPTTLYLSVSESITHSALRYVEPARQSVPPRSKQLIARIQKMVVRILPAFASGRFCTNRQKSVFGKSVDSLGHWATGCSSAAFTL